LHSSGGADACRDFTAHYLEGLTLERIGARMGLTREWVRQLEQRGLALLRLALVGEEVAVLVIS
jgi:DNA-directed RNA polymerase sigma subunit (sigma70/sigma32)